MFKPTITVTTIAAALGLALCASGAQAASMNHDAIACSDPAYYDKIIMAAGGGDKELATRLWTYGILTGSRTFLKQGEKVFVDDIQAWPPMDCVRPANGAGFTCFWTELHVVAE